VELVPSFSGSNSRLDRHALRARDDGKKVGAPRNDGIGVVDTSDDGVSGRKALVAVGGGKDSIVTLEALRATGVGETLFSVNSYPAITDTARVSGFDYVKATRKLDPQIAEINASWGLNGHVPVTAMNSLIAVLTALRGGLDYVVFSNERSASAPTRTDKFEANHQWSKGLDFEKLLSHLLEDTGVPVHYFSLLRPISELRIARAFSTLKQYHPVFVSCNRAFKLSDPARRWCRDCPKCRFVWLALSPYLSRAELVKIFGGDMFADLTQDEGFRELMELGADKPFECVGEVQESRVAAWLTLAHASAEERAQIERVLGGFDLHVDSFDEAYVFSFSREHQLPEEFLATAQGI
jgi:hypothetical protein